MPCSPTEANRNVSLATTAALRAANPHTKWANDTFQRASVAELDTISAVCKQFDPSMCQAAVVPNVLLSHVIILNLVRCPFLQVQRGLPEGVAQPCGPLTTTMPICCRAHAAAAVVYLQPANGAGQAILHSTAQDCITYSAEHSPLPTAGLGNPGCQEEARHLPLVSAVLLVADDEQPCGERCMPEPLQTCALVWSLLIPECGLLQVPDARPDPPGPVQHHGEAHQHLRVSDGHMGGAMPAHMDAVRSTCSSIRCCCCCCCGWQWPDHWRLLPVLQTQGEAWRTYSNQNHLVPVDFNDGL
jgi:hypothetical protein